MTHVVFPFLSLQALVEFFGTLSKEWALDCMKELLQVNMRGNLQIIVQVRMVEHQVRLQFKNLMMLIVVAVLVSPYIGNCRDNVLTYKCTCIQVAKEYGEQLGVDSCVKLFESFKSFEGLYFFLGAYLSTRSVFSCWL